MVYVKTLLSNPIHVLSIGIEIGKTRHSSVHLDLPALLKHLSFLTVQFTPNKLTTNIFTAKKNKKYFLLINFIITISKSISFILLN